MRVFNSPPFGRRFTASPRNVFPASDPAEAGNEQSLLLAEVPVTPPSRLSVAHKSSDARPSVNSAS